MEPSSLSLQKRFWFTIGAILTIFLAFEIFLHVAQFIFRFNEFKSERDRELDLRANVAAYHGKAWAKPYYDELKNMETTFDPLVGWRPKEFHGTYMNISADAMRKTWNPATTTASGRVITVFMFGGSTMLGAGTPDDYTIPSYVSQILNASAPPGVNYRVENFGQSGYVSVQEVAKLTLLLERGERPDYVIFYDGANDTSYAYQSGVSGITGGLSIIQDQFNQQLAPSSGARVSTWIKDSVKSSCFSCRIVFDLIRKIDPHFLNPNVIEGQRLSDAQLSALAGQISQGYRRETLAYLNELSQGFHFKLFVFWQPTMYTESKIVGEESTLGAIDPHILDQTAKKLFIQVNTLLPTNPTSHFYNISDAFAGRDHEFYIDYTHVSDDGDRVVAERMVHIITP